MPTKLITIAALDGRNGADPPISLPDTQAVEMLNVDRYDGLLARKRGGSTAVTDTGGTAFSSGLQTVIRHVPGSDETAAEFWGIDGAATPIAKRMTGGTSFANVTVDDAIATRPQDVIGATLNGKLFLAYDSSVDRLHAYDPSLASARVRRVGINPGTNAPTAANSVGGGGAAAVLRYYRVRFLQMSGTVVIRKSEPTPSVSFTPDGAHASVVVTRPTAPGEGETHWIVEGSGDDATYYVITAAGSADTSAIAIATTTDTDPFTAGPTTYTSRLTSAQAGLYSLFPSVKTLLTDGNRLLGAGAWETSGTISGGKSSRVWFTPVLGSTDKGDDERVPNTATQKNWIDLNENDGGGITGLGGPLNGVPFAFKYRQVWKLGPTGDVTAPYLPRKLSDAYGLLTAKAVCIGRDRSGNPALYFLSADGPCRLILSSGVALVQYLGRDVEDIWAGVNLAATTVVAHAVYHADKHQVWFWIATGSSNDPDTKLVFDVLLGQYVEGDRVRAGWFKHTGDSAAARCSCLMSNTLGASMSRDLKPYIGRASGTAIQKCDSSATNDAGTNFQAYVKTKPIPIAPLGMNAGVGQSHLLAKVGAAVTITQTLDRDYGLETRTATVLLTADASETRVLRKIEGSDFSQAGALQIQIGDAAAASNAWTLDALAIPCHTEDRR